MEMVGVLEQQSVPVQGVEHQHGMVDGVVGEAVERRQRVASEGVLNRGMGSTECDDGGLGGLTE